MSLLASIFVLAGAAVAVLAGVGAVRFSSPFARFHAAGKASPIAFLLVAIGAAVEVSWAGRALLLTVAAAMLLTLPFAVHLLFRAVYKTRPDLLPLVRDDLDPDAE